MDAKHILLIKSNCIIYLPFHDRGTKGLGRTKLILSVDSQAIHTISTLCGLVQEKLHLLDACVVRHGCATTVQYDIVVRVAITAKVNRVLSGGGRRSV